MRHEGGRCTRCRKDACGWRCNRCCADAERNEGCLLWCRRACDSAFSSSFRCCCRCCTTCNGGHRRRRNDSVPPPRSPPTSRRTTTTPSQHPLTQFPPLLFFFCFSLSEPRQPSASSELHPSELLHVSPPSSAPACDAIPVSPKCHSRPDSQPHYA